LTASDAMDKMRIHQAINYMTTNHQDVINTYLPITPKIVQTSPILLNVVCFYYFLHKRFITFDGYHAMSVKEKFEIFKQFIDPNDEIFNREEVKWFVNELLHVIEGKIADGITNPTHLLPAQTLLFGLTGTGKNSFGYRIIFGFMVFVLTLSKNVSDCMLLTELFCISHTSQVTSLTYTHKSVDGIKTDESTIFRQPQFKALFNEYTKKHSSNKDSIDEFVDSFVKCDNVRNWSKGVDSDGEEKIDLQKILIEKANCLIWMDEIQSLVRNDDIYETAIGRTMNENYGQNIEQNPYAFSNPQAIQALRNKNVCTVFSTATPENARQATSRNVALYRLETIKNSESGEFLITEISPGPNYRGIKDAIDTGRFIQINPKEEGWEKKFDLAYQTMFNMLATQENKNIVVRGKGDNAEYIKASIKKMNSFFGKAASFSYKHVMVDSQHDNDLAKSLKSSTKSRPICAILKQMMKECIHMEDTVKISVGGVVCSVVHSTTDLFQFGGRFCNNSGKDFPYFIVVTSKDLISVINNSYRLLEIIQEKASGKLGHEEFLNEFKVLKMNEDSSITNWMINGWNILKGFYVDIPFNSEVFDMSKTDMKKAMQHAINLGLVTTKNVCAGFKQTQEASFKLISEFMDPNDPRNDWSRTMNETEFGKKVKKIDMDTLILDNPTKNKKENSRIISECFQHITQRPRTMISWTNTNRTNIRVWCIERGIHSDFSGTRTRGKSVIQAGN